MGTIYYVGCIDCGIYRDLDKHMSHATETPHNREEAIEYCETEILKHSFRYGLLTSFLLDHSKHECVFFDEYTGQFEGYLDNLSEECIDFWGTNEYNT